MKVLLETIRASTGACAYTFCSGAREIATKRRPMRAPPSVAVVIKKLAYSEGTISVHTLFWKLIHFMYSIVLNANLFA
jgi:hypothetical protein